MLRHLAFAYCVLTLTAVSLSAEPVDFNRDIRPLLSDRCFACHGPDEATREADLRLDLAESTTEDRGGYRAIAPGKADDSELIARILSTDADLQMPPPEFGKPLSADQVTLLRHWIDQGAEYKQHWSLKPLIRPAVPAVPNVDQVATPVDAFIVAGLESAGLQPSPTADARTLARRLAFDLTGLPPDREGLDAFLADPRSEAYSQLVDTHLHSPHYGERMAMYWLDLVRYADSLGYHGDQEHSVSPYRDYVIQAFNNNIPFDQFTTEQLAGDLLPDSSLEQKVASTYNRLNRASGEGGGQPKEYLAKYSADRTRTTAAVWLGSTLGCAECHDHKFDAFTARDFYSFAAFFADIKEEGIVSGAVHVAQLPVPSAAQQLQLEKLRSLIADVDAQLELRSPETLAAQRQWEHDFIQSQAAWKLLTPITATATGDATLTIREDGSILASGTNPDKTNYKIVAETDMESLAAIRLELLTDDSLPSQGPGRAANGNFVLQSVDVLLTEKQVEWTAAIATHTQVHHSPEYIIKGNKNGWAILPEIGKPHQLILTTAKPVSIDASHPQIEINLGQQFGGGHALGKFRIYASEQVANHALSSPDAFQLLAVIEKPEDQRSDAERNQLWRSFRETAPQFAELRQRLKQLQAQQRAIEGAIPTTLATTAITPREIRILPRGDWMNDSGPVVSPAVPQFLTTQSIQSKSDVAERLDRLDLAEWLCDAENPLVARTMVNRLWMLYFGHGLSRSVDDLGAQGEPPSHPALLDWLAVEFIESGWDVRHVIDLIVRSKTYQQSSHPTPQQRSLDPYNRLLSRQSRWRLDAEMVRDNALAVSGLLVREIGGKSVRPYQPAGYWGQLNFPQREYQQDAGTNQYRRGVYTHWQRTYLHPSMLAFDAPAREECTARRDRSNTPLQALVLLNDPSYVEAARVLAERVLTETSGDFDERLNWVFQVGLTRPARPQESDVLRNLYRSSLDAYREHPELATAATTVGQTAAPSELDQIDLASWTMVTRAVLNLHEMIMRY